MATRAATPSPARGSDGLTFHPSRLVVAASIVATLWCASPASAQLVTRFEVVPSAISPNGDTDQDQASVRYALGDTAIVASLVVFAADSVTPVDTLRAPAPDGAPLLRTFTWGGQRWDGTPMPEGPYVVTLSVTGLSQSVRQSLPVFIDLTPPTLQILGVAPDPYTPGLPPGATANISFVAGSTSPLYPGRIPDKLSVAITDPNGAPVDSPDIVTTPPFEGTDGTYIMEWNAGSEVTKIPDGEYKIALTLTDFAGYTATSSYYLTVDTKNPAIKVTNLNDGSRVGVVPDSLRGFAHDASGVDSLYVKYPSSPYELVTNWYVQDDTLRFAVVMADSFSTPGSYSVFFRAVDGAGRAGKLEFKFTYDTTPPLAPTLTPFKGTWHSRTFRVTGTADNGGDTATLVRVARNGSPIDSTLVLKGEFAFNVPLVAGRNVIVATLKDGAGNVGPPSNAVIVDFDTKVGLFAPAPFTPGAVFDLNAPRLAQAADLRIFDLRGDVVVRFSKQERGPFYAFTWNGNNASGSSVRRGPLVAVATLTYDDGTRDVFRAVFLFDPVGP